MLLALRTLALAIAIAAVPACMTPAISCTRSADGSVTCNVELHQDGDHDKPLK